MVLTSNKIVRINESGDEKCVIFKIVTAMWANLQSCIEDVCLKISPGQLCAIIGPVCSGKSTIFHTITQELEKNKGELTVKGIVSY